MALLVLTIPVIRLPLSGGEPARLLLGCSLIGLCLGTLALSTFLAELFPPASVQWPVAQLRRGECLAQRHGPALATFLVRHTSDVLAAAWYATGLTVVAVACVLLAPETLGRPLDQAG